MSFEQGFLKDSIKRFKYYKELGDKTFEQIDEAAVFYQPSTESNSIAIIVQHMYGNMLSRWTNFLTEDGEKEWRKRDAEFEVMKCSKQDILAFWNDGWKCIFYIFLSTLLSPLVNHSSVPFRSICVHTNPTRSPILSRSKCVDTFAAHRFIIHMSLVQYSSRHCEV